MSDILLLQFCHQIAAIHCPDSELAEALTGYFRHHLVTTASSPLVVYKIIPPSAASASWRVQRGEQISFTTSERRYLFAYLAYEVVAYLVNHSPDYVVLHAAGLARAEGGAIFCAPSGSGKSTLTTWLVAAGWAFLSDEMVAISALDGQMYGLAIPIVLQETAIFQAQPWFSPQSWPYKLPDVTWLDPMSIRPQVLPASVQPYRLIFPHYTSQTAFRVQPLSAAAATFRLWPRIINYNTWPDKGLALAKKLAQQIPAYQVIYPDLSQLTEWLDSFPTL